MKVNIPNAKLDDFKAKISKLVKRGKKLGCPDIKVSYGEIFARTNKEGKTFSFIPVEINGEAPVINNFSEIEKLSENYDSEFQSGFGNSWAYLDIKTVLNIAANVILSNGFVSKRVAEMSDQFSTSDLVRTIACDTKPVKTSEAGKSLAIKSYEYIKKELKVNSDNQYQANLAAIFSQEFCESRDIGLVASAITVYQRSLEKIIRDKKTTDLQKSKYFGEEKKREEFTLTVLKQMVFDGSFGPTSMYQMIDENGNVAIWWTGTGNLDQGTTYKLKATVKKHDEYKGIKQTTLTRCKILEERKHIT